MAGLEQKKETAGFTCQTREGTVHYEILHGEKEKW